MIARQCGARTGLVIALVMIALGGCNVDATSNTGIRVNVVLHDSVDPNNAANIVDTLRFYVAVQDPNADIYVLNEAASGIVVDVTDRDLLNDAYQLLISRNGAWMKSVRVVVVGERNGQGVLYGQLSDPASQAFLSGQIVQRTIVLRPEGLSFDMSWTITGCLTSSQPRSPDLEPFVFGSLTDRDCDGWEDFEDCDDLDPTVNPGVEEGYDCDGVDNNCDGIVDPGGHDDFDSDGITACEGDCNDEDPAIHPGAPEVCDGVDNNCNDKCDEGEDIDQDRDGYADCGGFGSRIDHDTGTCGWFPVPDCDDTDPTVHPGAEERCNGQDDNCDGICDEGQDPDGDGYTHCGSTDPTNDGPEGSCVELSTALQDCGPEDPTVHPFTDEVCDGVDTNCDGTFSTATSDCYEMDGADGECHRGSMECNEDEGETWGDCNPEEGPPSPLAKCGIWHYCEDAPNPTLCMDLSVHWYTMACHLRYYGSWTAGLCGGNGSRPIYYLPFGFSGNNDCTWHLLVQGAAGNYQEIGLVDPNDAAAPAQTVLESCEAALVAWPQANTTQNPGSITAILSFYYDNGGGDFYAMEMPVTINPMTECPQGNESLTCTIN